jgi:hypothetical protein
MDKQFGINWGLYLSSFTGTFMYFLEFMPNYIYDIGIPYFLDVKLWHVNLAPPLRRSFQNCGILRATIQSQGCRILDASMKIWRPVRWRRVWLSLKPTVPWSGWWFRTCFIFPYIGNNDPNRPLMHSAGQILLGPACRFSWILESWF